MDVETLKSFGTALGVIVGLPTVLVIFKIGIGWGGITKAVTDIASSLHKLSDDLGGVKEEVRRWSERAAVIESKVETVRSDIANLRESRHEHTGQIFSSEGDIGVHETRLDGHDNDIANLREGTRGDRRSPSINRRSAPRKGGKRKTDPR